MNNTFLEEKSVLSRHLDKKFICQYCQKGFTRKNNMIVHQKNRCNFLTNKRKISVIKNNSCNQEEKISQLEKQIAELIGDKQKTKKEINELNEFRQKTDEEIDRLKNKPSNVNQILQVVCVSSSDNYLDMLTDEWNSFDRALEYIKDCA